MNMFSFESSAQQACSADEWRILDFYATRAGRAVANAAVMGVTDQGPKEVVCWGGGNVLLGARNLPLTTALRGRWDEDSAALLIPFGRIVDATPMETVETDDPDADIVRWFEEQQTEVEKARSAALPVVGNDSCDNEEVMLTRRNGSRSRRSWRGGGTMHRR